MPPSASPESCTDMRECRHWKKNCHKCLFRELVEVVERILFDYSISYADLRGHVGEWCEYDEREVVIAARALIEKAKLVEECEGT